MKTLITSLVSSVAMTGTAFAADVVLAPEPAPVEIVEPTLGGFYIAGRGAASFADDTEFDVGALGIDSVENDYDTGFLGVLGAGYAFGALRAEIEVSYATYDIDTHTARLTGGGEAEFTDEQSFGDANALALMASGYYDLQLGPIAPFVGAGIGFGRVEANGFGVTPLEGDLPGGVALDDSDTGIAYHLTAGVGFDVTNAITVEAGYRYQGIDADLASVTEAESDFNLDSHNAFAGLRIGF